MKVSFFRVSLALLIIFSISFTSNIESKERFYIKVGELKSIFTDSPYRISISDPAIADVTSVAKKEILIIGKSPGNTIINIWDKFGKQEFSVDVYLENLSSLKDRIERLLKSAGIVDAVLDINQDEDKIVISGNVRDVQKPQFDLLITPFQDKLINLIKFTEESASVLIDVNVLELSKTALDDLGIDWPQFLTGTESGTPVSTAVKFMDMFKIGDWSRTALSARLNLIVRNGDGKILSRPKLVCLSGKEAEFLVGGEVPIVTTLVSDVGVSTNVEYKEYGVSLKIKPTIEGKDGIRTGLTTEVSELDWTNAVIASGIRIPALTNRSTSTEVFIKEGQTIFLAGLLKNKDSTTINRVPGLGDVPVLGHLFRSRDFTNDQTELVITLTPTIIHNETASKFVSVDGKEEEIAPPPEKIVEPPPKETKEESTEALKEPINNYAQSVQKIISEKFFYPKEAKDNNQSGTVILSLCILSDGTISDVVLSQSCGFEALDESAISLVKDIASFGPFPNNLSLQDLCIDIPIKYNLD